MRVYSLSRLARNARETLEIGECLGECGADLVSLSEKINIPSAAGKIVFRMMAVLPVGKRVTEDRKGRVKDADEARLIAWAKRLRCMVMSLRRIAEKLTDESYTGRGGATR